MKEDKKDSLIKGTGCLILFFGISFVLSSIGVILTLVFSGSLRKYFIDENGEDSFWWYKAQFWIVVVTFIVFLGAEGKIGNLTFPEGYKDNKDDKSI